MNYRDLNDYELLSYVSENEESSEIIFEKYRPLIFETANRMYVYCQNSGIEINDLVQEGMIGLNDAIKTFNDSKDTKFYTYALKCIKSKMISSIVAARRLKNKILNDSVFLELSESDKSNNFGKNLIDNSYNPEEVLISKEEKNKILDIIDQKLTDFEKEVITLKINGFKYREIADILGKNQKLIDNTMQKVKKIIREQMQEK